MTAGGDQNGDPGLGIAPVDGLQHGWNQKPAGNGPGVVAGDEDDIFLAPGQLLQRGGSDGPGQGLGDQLRFPRGGHIFLQTAPEHGVDLLLRNLGGKVILSIGERDFHGGPLLVIPGCGGEVC